LIPDRSTFPIDLIKYIYENFHEKIILEIHLMVKEPNLLVQEINEFIEPRNRKRISMIIQREAYITEEEITNTLRTIKELGYKAGISLNLPTPFNRLTDEMMRDADLVLIMSVPMGKGGQEYDEQATERIKDISNRFPSKPIKVDGGINDMTAQTVKKAGAEIFVVGSYLTKNGDPFGALERIERILKNP